MAKDNNNNGLEDFLKRSLSGIIEETVNTVIKSKEHQDFCKTVMEDNKLNDDQKIKIQEIKRKIIEANTVIEKVNLCFQPAIIDDTLIGLKIAEGYLRLASVMSYIFNLIETLSTGDEAKYIEEYFVFYLKGQRKVITQGMITDALENKRQINIFQLKKDKDEVLGFTISNLLNDYKILKQTTEFDKSVDRHWENYKKFTVDHYFGAGITGRRLYYTLGLSDEYTDRSQFWQWWHSKVDAEDRNFKSLIDYFLSGASKTVTKTSKKGNSYNITITALSKDLQTFLTTLRDDDKDHYEIFNSTGGGNLNLGNVAESFERHLEGSRHNFNSNGYPNDTLSPLNADYPDESFNQWLQNLAASTGRYPGVYGPDTTYAQVKQYAVTGKSAHKLMIEKEKFQLASETLNKISAKINDIDALSKIVTQIKQQYNVDKASIEAVAKDLEENHLSSLGFNNNNTNINITI